MFNGLKIAAVIPAHNEQIAIGRVVSELISLADDNAQRLIDEVIVCDNDSDDLTAEYAEAAGARVVFERYRGYGAACKAAIGSIQCAADVVIFIDGDYAFNTAQVMDLLEPIATGAELVIGSRSLGIIEPGAMTWVQRLANPVIGRLLQLLWGYPVTDLGPFRAIRYSALQQLQMRDHRYGWTVEMQVKAIANNMRVVEVPVDTRCRLGASKISGTWRGTVGATFGIIGTISRLWWADQASLG